MGLARKAISIATAGMVHYRSANQQTAHYAKKSYQLQKRQARNNVDKPSAAEEIAAAMSVIRDIRNLLRRRKP